MGEVGRPKGDGPVSMAKVDNGVVRILGHGAWGAELRAVLDEQLPSGSVLVLQVASVSLYALIIRRQLAWHSKVRHTTLASNQWKGRNSSRVGSMCDFS